MNQDRDEFSRTARREGAALARRHARVALACSAFVALMVGVSFAAVPLYDLFCRVTGFGGTPRVAAGAPSETGERRIVVRFDANVAGGLPWRFAPEVREIEVAVGETALIPYFVVNEGSQATVGTATYNVSPPQAGYYFVKMQCFCFTEQRLEAGERMNMPVAFYIDPAITDDPDHRSLKSITLSYTFFPARSAAPQASRATSRAPM